MKQQLDVRKSPPTPPPPPKYHIIVNLYKIIKTNILGYNDWRYGENFALIFILGW